jgi:hypothetical protein
MTKYIKWGIWAYLILLIFEGSLRKWVFPGASDMLLVIRDPIVLGIYMLAIMNGTFPRSGFIKFAGFLAVASFAFAFLGGQTNIWVTLFGVRTNYLHVPLIWIMAETLDRRDVRQIGYAILAIAIPMTLLMVMQNRGSPDAWVNRGAGGSEGSQITGAMGRIRPPGFFSFITGPMVFLPLATSFVLAFIIEKKKLIITVFVMVAAVFVALALPISISRGVMIMCGLVAAVFICSIIIKGAFNATFVRALFGVALVLVALSFLPITKEAWMVFMDRWDTASAEVQGDAWGSLTDRVADGFTAPFNLMLDVPFFGHGIGVGSNVGAKLLSGRVGFLLSENEWERAMMELGPLLGLGFIGMRTALTLHLLILSWHALRKKGDFLPMLITSASVPSLLLLQWSVPTQLGFAIFEAGLVLALIESPIDDDDEEEDEDRDDEDDEEDDASDSPDDAPPDPLSEYEKRRRRMRGLA